MEKTIITSTIEGRILGSHIDASHSRQPLVKDERLVRYEVVVLPRKCERLRYVPHFIPRVPISVLRVVIYNHLERFDGGDEAGASLLSCIAPSSEHVSNTADVTDVVVRSDHSIS